MYLTFFIIKKEIMQIFLVRHQLERIVTELFDFYHIKEQNFNSLPFKFCAVQSNCFNKISTLRKHYLCSYIVKQWFFCGNRQILRRRLGRRNKIAF